MANVLVTGAAGFIGSHLVGRLLADGHNVHVFLRSSSDTWRINDLLSKCNVHRADYCDGLALLLDSLGRDSISAIFHTAAYGCYPRQTNFLEMVRSNILLTRELAGAAADLGITFINTGSSSEYGFKAFAPRESSRLEPNSEYAITKAAATHEVQYIARSHKAWMPTLRLYSVFGPKEDSGRLLPTIIREGMEGRFPPLASPQTVRDFIYIKDVIDAYIAVWENVCPHDNCVIYNVGTGVETSINDVVNIAKAILPIKGDPHFCSYPAREWDTVVWKADNSLLQCHTGWKPKHTFAEGFADMVADAYRLNPRKAGESSATIDSTAS